jgi:hypothetical protein
MGILDPSFDAMSYATIQDGNNIHAQLSPLALNAETTTEIDLIERLLELDLVLSCTPLHK